MTSSEEYYQVVRSNASAALLGKDPAKDCRFFLSNRLEEWVILERSLDKPALLNMHSSYWFARLLVLRLIPLLTLCMFAGSCSWDNFLIHITENNDNYYVRLLGFVGVGLSLFALWKGSMNVILTLAMYLSYNYISRTSTLFYHSNICNDQALLDILFWTAFQVPFWSLEPMAEQVPPPIIGMWGYKLISLGLAVHDIGDRLPPILRFIPWGPHFTKSWTPTNIIYWSVCYWQGSWFASIAKFILQLDVYLLVLASFAILFYPTRSCGSLLALMHMACLLYRLISGTQVTLSLFISIVLCPAWMSDSLLWCFFKQKELRRVPLLLRADQVCTPWRPLSSFFNLLNKKNLSNRERYRNRRDILAMSLLLSSPVDNPDYCNLIRKASQHSTSTSMDEGTTFRLRQRMAQANNQIGGSELRRTTPLDKSNTINILSICRVISIVLVWTIMVCIIIIQYNGFSLTKTVAVIVTGFVLGIFLTAVLFPPPVFDSIKEPAAVSPDTLDDDASHSTDTLSLEGKQPIEMAGRTVKAAWWCSFLLSTASLLIIWVLEVGWCLPTCYITAALGIAAVTLQTIGRSGCVCYTHIAKRRGRTLSRLMTGGLTTAAYSSWVRIVVIRSIREIALLYLLLTVGIPVSPPPLSSSGGGGRLIQQPEVVVWWPQLAILIHNEGVYGWHTVNLPYLPVSSSSKPDTLRFVPQRLSFLLGYYAYEERPQDTPVVKQLLCQTFSESAILLRHFIKLPPKTLKINGVRLERRWLKYHNAKANGDLDAIIDFGKYFDENISRREKLAELWKPCPTM